MSGGFDAVVGNPPFMGGTTISGRLSSPYLHFLTTTFDRGGDRTDLVAYFFRRAYGLMRDEGTFGLVATNTISQGDTRHAALEWIRSHGGTIFAARRRLVWPGAAAVVVSVVHVRKAAVYLPCTLDGRVVSTITAYLFHVGPDASPAPIPGRSSVSFEGFKLAGQGFLFADDDEEASPLTRMRELIDRDRRNAERILPYLGGEDVNASPKQEHHRYAIYFGTMSEEEAAAWPDLLDIVRQRVKPKRDRAARDAHRKRWWQYGESRPGLLSATRTMSRVLVTPRVSRTGAFVFVTPHQILNEKIVVLALDEWPDFAILQSRVHEAWARFFSSTMKDDMQYTPSECFVTFPVPTAERLKGDATETGRSYHEFRAALMTRNNEGLTKTYNRFHDPDERSAEIVQLRDLHAQMDRAVLDAYGWADIWPACDFREQLDESIRFTWTDDARDEVLARLLELNRVRAEAERDAAPKESTSGTRTRRSKAGAVTHATAGVLPGIDEAREEPE